MSEQWRDRYDSWKTDAGTQHADVVLDEDGEPIDPDEEAARAEDAAIERAERQREDMMFDRDSQEDW